MCVYIYTCVCVRYLKLSHQGIAYACLYAPSNMIPSTVGPHGIHQIKWLYYSDTGVLTSTSRDVFFVSDTTRAFTKSGELRSQVHRQCQ